VPEKLDAGSQFPATALQMLDGSRVTLPEDLTTPYAVVLLYRGHW
jgi:hypothetical protein